MLETEVRMGADGGGSGKLLVVQTRAGLVMADEFRILKSRVYMHMYNFLCTWAC